MSELVQHCRREVDGIRRRISIDPEVPVTDAARECGGDVESCRVEILAAVLICQRDRVPEIRCRSIWKVLFETAGDGTAEDPGAERRKFRAHRNRHWSDDQAGPDVDGVL